MCMNLLLNNILECSLFIYQSNGNVHILVQYSYCFFHFFPLFFYVCVCVGGCVGWCCERIGIFMLLIQREVA